jgi:glycosyltransferase involved in cell wall biosynthesis
MNGNNIKISIALATYNGQGFIREQIESILNQSIPDFELIISDDGSTDKTIEIITEYQKHDNRIFLIHNKRTRGFVNNFENALVVCKGEYIALADQDDIWSRNKLEQLISKIMNKSLIHSDAKLIDGRNEIISESYSHLSNKIKLPTEMMDIVLNNPVTGCTCMFTKSLLRKSLPFPKGIAVHDKWLALNAIIDCGIAYSEEPLISYRQHGNNQIGAKGASNKKLKNKVEKLLSKPIKLIMENEKKQLDLVIIIILNKDIYNNLSMRNKVYIHFLYYYYKNIINSNIPFVAFFIRCLMFSKFEKKQPLKSKVSSLICVFKLPFIKIIRLIYAA